MARFIRTSEPEPLDAQHPGPSDDERAEMLARVNAYAAPITPDPESPLSPREQLVKGITRPGGQAPPRRRARY